MRIYSDCRFRPSFGHSGGLPGYGSSVPLIPEHDIGIFAFANRTYAPAALVVKQAAVRLYDTGALKTVSKRGGDALVRIEQAVAKIYASGSVTAEPQALRAQLGECRARSEMDVRHTLSVVLRYPCDPGHADRNGSAGTYSGAVAAEAGLRSIGLAPRSRSVATMAELSLHHRKEIGMKRSLVTLALLGDARTEGSEER